MAEYVIIFFLIVGLGILYLRYRRTREQVNELRIDYLAYRRDVGDVIREEIESNLRQMLRVYKRMRGYGATRGRQLLRECVMNLYAEAHQMHSTLLAYEELVDLGDLPIEEGQAMNYKEYFRLYAMNNLGDVVAYGFTGFSQVMAEIEAIYERMSSS